MPGLEAASPYVAAASAGLGLLEGGYQFFHSLSDEKKSKAELERLQRPFYDIQNEFYQNRNMAAQQAQGGLTSTAKDYYTSQTERGLGSGVQAILGVGGDAGDISKLFDRFSQSTFNVAAADSEAQAKNIQYFMDTNKDLAGQKITQWSLNELQPYEDKLAQLTERIKADEQNKFGGVNTAIGSLTAAGTSLSNAGLMNAEKGMFDRMNPQQTTGQAQSPDAQAAMIAAAQEAVKLKNAFSKPIMP
jgi:hypothetical protein